MPTVKRCVISPARPRVSTQLCAPTFSTLQLKIEAEDIRGLFDKIDKQEVPPPALVTAAWVLQSDREGRRAIEKAFALPRPPASSGFALLSPRPGPSKAAKAQQRKRAAAVPKQADAFAVDMNLFNSTQALLARISNSSRPALAPNVTTAPRCSRQEDADGAHASPQQLPRVGAAAGRKRKAGGSSAAAPAPAVASPAPRPLGTVQVPSAAAAGVDILASRPQPVPPWQEEEEEERATPARASKRARSGGPVSPPGRFTRQSSQQLQRERMAAEIPVPRFQPVASPAAAGPSATKGRKHEVERTPPRPDRVLGGPAPVPSPWRPYPRPWDVRHAEASGVSRQMIQPQPARTRQPIHPMFARHLFAGGAAAAAAQGYGEPRAGPRPQQGLSRLDGLQRPGPGAGQAGGAAAPRQVYLLGSSCIALAGCSLPCSRAMPSGPRIAMRVRAPLVLCCRAQSPRPRCCLLCLKGCVCVPRGRRRVSSPTWWSASPAGP